MQILPEFSITWLNGFLLILPFVFIRLLVMKWVSPEGIKRAAFFPPLNNKEKPFMSVYMVTNLLAIFYPLLLSLKTGTLWFWIGLPLYLLGLVFLVLSIIDFSKAPADKVIEEGIYRYSRNPMYVAYDLIYFGIGIATAAWLYLLIVAIFQYTVHIMIISEERWCLQQFGEEYQSYTDSTRRYWGQN
jgi:protein-S-isoprenylcysteine O-methyltransferase Ste14